MSAQVVHIRINDAATGKPTPVRVRFTGPDGTYLAPLGRTVDFPLHDAAPIGGNVQIAGQRCAYIDGGCEIMLPDGDIQIEASKGCEYRPLLQTWQRAHGQISFRHSIERAHDLQKEGWYAGDTHAFHLSPAAAALEGSAEGLHVVNLLAVDNVTESGRWVSRMLDFSGQAPAVTAHGCLVVVNTLNQGGELGDLALLNCHRPVFPLRLDEPGFEKWTLADWCQQAHRKAGLVVWTGFPGELGNRLANLVLGRIDAIEWSIGTPFDTNGLSLWYRLLDAGLRVPLVGGSGKCDNTVPLGAVRTYARAGGELTYRAWIEAVRSGQSFVTRGPLLRFKVNGQLAGSVIEAPATSSEVQLEASASSVTPFDRLELVQTGGEVLASVAADQESTATLSLRYPVQSSGWLAARCFGSDGLVAHTSPVYLAHAVRPARMSAARSELASMRIGREAAERLLGPA